MSPAELIALSNLAVTGIQTALQIAATVQQAVNNSKELTATDKEELIARIRTAQTSVPEWE